MRIYVNLCLTFDIQCLMLYVAEASNSSRGLGTSPLLSFGFLFVLLLGDLCLAAL